MSVPSAGTQLTISLFVFSPTNDFEFHFTDHVAFSMESDRVTSVYIPESYTVVHEAHWLHGRLYEALEYHHILYEKPGCDPQ